MYCKACVLHDSPASSKSHNGIASKCKSQTILADPVCAKALRELIVALPVDLGLAFEALYAPVTIRCPWCAYTPCKPESTLKSDRREADVYQSKKCK